MLKNILLPALLLLCFCACSNEPENGFTLTGKIDGLKSAKVYREIYNGSGLEIVDSVTTDKDGSFTMTGKVDKPVKVNMLFQNSRGVKEFLCSSFFIENRVIDLRGDLKQRSKIKPGDIL